MRVDARTLRQPGDTGDDWRLHLADAFTAGRLGQVHVTARYGGERLAPCALWPGDIAGADHGYGYRASVAAAAEVTGHLPLGWRDRGLWKQAPTEEHRKLLRIDWVVVGRATIRFCKGSPRQRKED